MAPRARGASERSRGEELIDADARYEPPECEQHRSGEDREHRARIGAVRVRDHDHTSIDAEMSAKREPPRSATQRRIAPLLPDLIGKGRRKRRRKGHRKGHGAHRPERRDLIVGPSRARPLPVLRVAQPARRSPTPLVLRRRFHARARAPLASLEVASVAFQASAEVAHASAGG